MSGYGDDDRERFIQGIIKSQEKSFEERVQKLTEQMVKNRNDPQPTPQGMKPRPVITQTDYENVRKQAEVSVKENDRRYLTQELSKRDKQAKSGTRSDASQVPDARSGIGKAADRVGAERERLARDLGEPQEKTVIHRGSLWPAPQGEPTLRLRQGVHGKKPDLWHEQGVHGPAKQNVKPPGPPGGGVAGPSASADRMESGQRRDVRSDFNKPPPPPKPPQPEQKAMLEQRIHGPAEQKVKEPEPDRVAAKVRSDFNKPPPPPKPRPPDVPPHHPKKGR